MPCPEIEDIIFMNNIIKDYIYNLDIPLGTSVRLDCPVCDGTNTLSVTQFSDCIKYYCFHANCSKGGVIKEGLSESSFSAHNGILKPHQQCLRMQRSVLVQCLQIYPRHLCLTLQ